MKTKVFKPTFKASKQQAFQPTRFLSTVTQYLRVLDSNNNQLQDSNNKILQVRV